LPKPVRIELAHQAWIKDSCVLKIKDVARRFGVAYSTLYDCIHSAILKELANQAMQRLSVAEEEAIQDWLVDLASWGWLLCIKQLQAMARELLIDKNNTVDLSVHWTDQFLH
jgi:phage FluMu gp28-like protein